MRKPDAWVLVIQYFAPTVLDSGVTKFTTGQVAEQVVNGFFRALAINNALGENKGTLQTVRALTYLAGPKNVESTRVGIEKAIAALRR